MSVRITLTDDVLPPSREFVEFLRQWIAGEPFDGSSWAEHGRERVRAIGGGPSSEDADQVLDSEEGVTHVSRAFELFVALLIGDAAALRTVHDRFRFLLVVGVPRSGGKYMTKQLLRALGHDPITIPAVLGHDGFPDAGPWRFGPSGNGWTKTMQTLAEYLTMVELFFGAATPHDGRVVVPKKMTKAVYAAGVVHAALGPLTEVLVTVRHPVPACVSTYETGGGLPADGRFAARSNIERFCARELSELGHTRSDIAAMDYFDAYLRYWENFHVRMAMAVPSLARTHDVVAYGADSYRRRARAEARRFGAAGAVIEPLHVREPHAVHDHWMERAEPALRRVREQWERVGLEFPLR